MLKVMLKNVGKDHQMDTLKAVTILLVEDDPGDQKLIKMSLRSEKIANDIHVVNSGEEALEYLQHSQAGDGDNLIPDLILLDLNMPGMGGKKFLKYLKSDERFKAIPVVILTSSSSDRDILESFDMQAAGYIKKPVGLEEFQRVMQDLNEYWFVICKRVYHGNKDRCKDSKYLILLLDDNKQEQP
jgi:CheY-like chemotaxis protein